MKNPPSPPFAKGGLGGLKYLCSVERKAIWMRFTPKGPDFIG
jgi:hypothetical protein